MAITECQTTVPTPPYATIRRKFEPSAIVAEPCLPQSGNRDAPGSKLKPERLPLNPTQPQSFVLVNSFLAFPLIDNQFSSSN